MKRTIAFILVAALCLCLCACGIKNPVGEEYSKESYIGIFNQTGRELKSLGLTRSFGGDAVGTTAVQNADGSLLGAEMLSFNLQKADVPEGADTAKFAMVLSVTEADGTVYQTAAQAFPLEFGTDYFFTLTYADGGYVLAREMPGGTGEMTVDIRDGKTIRNGTSCLTYQVAEGETGTVTVTISGGEGSIGLDICRTDAQSTPDYRGRELDACRFAVELTEPGEYQVRISYENYTGNCEIAWSTAKK